MCYRIWQEYISIRNEVPSGVRGKWQIEEIERKRKGKTGDEKE
jgi:hypothetical protein